MYHQTPYEDELDRWDHAWDRAHDALARELAAPAARRWHPSRGFALRYADGSSIPMGARSLRRDSRTAPRPYALRWSRLESAVSAAARQAHAPVED